ncbi:nuclear transport factor 2 family protein [Aquimarina gracilis]|uniref:Nuclear transport factor 2 family protein n=1 Tax=Aquimarina gracilis TaxID=874422 RepID=A0ABU5ZWF7_9FLAO|nr:nuclear transport factor 2 family protein [Aquimarina gracilis]MEB3346185.1 nuclear transport factor 2 family protein [Aquimarina gracilis]
MSTVVNTFCATLFCLLFSLKINSQSTNQVQKDSLVNLVNTYYSQNIKIFAANSSVEDINNVFDLFTNDFVYVHPKYGGTYSRQKLYDGYIRNQKNGGYDGSVIDIKIVNMITGLNAIAVERKYITKTESGIKDGDYQMTLFEFKNGKISKIFEYW